jgi:hypothetical protein
MSATNYKFLAVLGIILLGRVGNQCQDLLVLVQQQHGSQISQALIRKPRGSQQLQTFDLAKVRSFPQREEVE